MATLREIRKDHPEYDDMSDGELAKRLHNKFYSDMSFNDFAKKIQLMGKPEEQSFFTGIGDTAIDVFKKGGKEMVDRLAGIPETAMALGSGAMSAITQPVHEYIGLAQGKSAADARAEAEAKTAATTYQPMSRSGQQQTDVLGRILGTPFEAARGIAGQPLRQMVETSPLGKGIEALGGDPRLVGQPLEEAATLGPGIAALGAAGQAARGGLARAGASDFLRKPFERSVNINTAPFASDPTLVSSLEKAQRFSQGPLSTTLDVERAAQPSMFQGSVEKLPLSEWNPDLAGRVDRFLEEGRGKPTKYTENGEPVDPPKPAGNAPGVPQVETLPETRPAVPSAATKGVRDEFYIKVQGEPVGIFKNPVEADFISLEDQFRRNHRGVDEAPYRTITDTQGNTYAWDSFSATHDDVMRGLSRMGVEAVPKPPTAPRGPVVDVTADSLTSRIRELRNEARELRGQSPAQNKAVHDRLNEVNAEMGELQIKARDLGVPLYGGIPGVAQAAAIEKWLLNTTPAKKLISFFVPEYAIPQGKEWMYSRQQAKGTLALGEKFADSFVRKHRNLKPEDRQKIWEQMNSGDPITSLPQELRGPANEFRLMDNMLGKMLVDQGLMSPETFEANAGNHIRYIYNIYQGGGNLLGGMGQKVDTKFLTSRKDLTDVQRQQLGLVKDPVQAIANSIVDTHKAVGMAEHFQTIADNRNWVFQPTSVVVDGKKMGIGKVQKMLDAYDGVERNGQTLNQEQVAYRKKLQGILEKVSATEVPKDYQQLNGSQYGALDGHFVRNEIAQDIRPIMDVFRSSSRGVQNFVNSVYTINALWKMKNVAWNIPTAARNIISNPNQMLMSGMRPDHVITRTIQAIIDKIKDGKYENEALREGVFQTNFTTGELQDILNIARNFDKTNWTGFLSEVQKLGKYYGKIDDIFKLAKFIDMREKGFSAKESAYQANKWGMDYSMAHPAIKYLRNLPVGAPFISYQYKIAPLIVESLRKRPWIIGGIMSIPWMLQTEVTKDMTDEDAKLYIESLPEYVRNKQVFLIPGKEGMNALDVSYMVPWGNWYQVGSSLSEGKVSKALKQLGISSGLFPTLMYGAITHKDLFTGKDIVTDLDKYDPKATAWALTKWMWQQAAPPMLTETSVLGKVSEHLKYGQTSRGLPTEGMNAWPRIVGVNIYPVDPLGKERGDRYEIQNVRKALMRKMFDQNLPDREREAAQEAYRMAVEKIQKPLFEPEPEEKEEDFD